MPTIAFYILSSNTKQKALPFACHLLEKIYQEQQSAYVHTASREEAEYADQLLWTYRDDSFIPHNLYSSTDDLPPAIQIGYAEPPPYQKNILLNLTPEIPTFYRQFNHIIEIVFSEPTVQQLARERYKQYREQGCELITHKIDR